MKAYDLSENWIPPYPLVNHVLKLSDYNCHHWGTCLDAPKFQDVWYWENNPWFWICWWSNIGSFVGMYHGSIDHLNDSHDMHSKVVWWLHRHSANHLRTWTMAQTHSEMCELLAFLKEQALEPQHEDSGAATLAAPRGFGSDFRAGFRATLEVDRTSWSASRGRT